MKLSLSSTTDGSPESLNLHGILAHSRANGPGVRTVIWFQGCTLGCPGCFNPNTHSFAPALRVSVEALIHHLAQLPADIEGITLSGGEPLQQPFRLLELLKGVRSLTRLSVLLFSGYSLEEIYNHPTGPDVLRLIDVLIDGRYVQNERLARGLRGSSNQTVHLLTTRYRLCDIEQVPLAEVVVAANGLVSISGVRPPMGLCGCAPANTDRKTSSTVRSKSPQSE